MIGDDVPVRGLNEKETNISRSCPVPLPPPPPPQPVLSRVSWSSSYVPSPSSLDPAALCLLSDDSTEVTNDVVAKTYELRGSPSVTTQLSFKVNEYRVADLPPFALEEPYMMFIEVSTQLQVGPTCGLLALSIVTYVANKRTTEVAVLLERARALGFSNHGEIFNSSYLLHLAEEFLGDRCSIELDKNNLLDDFERVWSLLTNNVLLLVPYDNDSNNSPGFNQGHRAHWCLVIGCCVFRGERFVCAVHGKSRKLSFWKLQLLALSNKQLYEPSSKIQRCEDEYVIDNIRANLSGHCLIIRLNPDVVIRVATCLNGDQLEAYFCNSQ